MVLPVDPHENLALIVAQRDVKPRHVTFYQLAFQKQRVQLGLRRYPFHVGDFRHQRVSLGITHPCILKIL
ncbi:MAG: hypothetical protein ACREQV_18860, partial [Candidatus Binatia bacterium]